MDKLKFQLPQAKIWTCLDKTIPLMKNIWTSLKLELPIARIYHNKKLKTYSIWTSSHFKLTWERLFAQHISSQATPCIPDKQSAVRLLKNIWTSLNTNCLEQDFSRTIKTDYAYHTCLKINSLQSNWSRIFGHIKLPKAWFCITHKT